MEWLKSLSTSEQGVSIVSLCEVNGWHELQDVKEVEKNRHIISQIAKESKHNININQQDFLTIFITIV